MSSVLEQPQKLHAASDDAIPDDPAGRLYRLSVEQYHAMAGVFANDERVELLEGLLVRKMTKNPPHVIALNNLRDHLMTMIEEGAWHLRLQDPIALDTSEPEPDLVVARGINTDFAKRHPRPGDCGLVAEVSDTTLHTDRVDKKTLYARNGIVEYWIVNLIEDQIEVYTEPTGPAEAPDYRSRADFKRGDAIRVSLDGTEIGTISVADVLP